MADEHALHVEVVTPDGEVYHDDVVMAVLPGVEVRWVCWRVMSRW